MFGAFGDVVKMPFEQRVVKFLSVSYVSLQHPSLPLIVGRSYAEVDALAVDARGTLRGTVQDVILPTTALSWYVIF